MWNQEYLKAQYLFLYYINDMPENIISTVRLFADDTIVYLTITSDVDRVHLQEDIDRLAHWEQTFKMSFHPEKCYVLSITKKRNPVTNCNVLHGHQLEQVQSGKYLCVVCEKQISQHLIGYRNHRTTAVDIIRRTEGKQPD